MSAYIVSSEVISRIFGCYVVCQRDKKGFSENKIKELGQKLLDANCISVNYRYNDDNDETFVLDREAFDQSCSIVQAIKYCDSLDYQSCEFPQWGRSEAKALLNKMRETFIGNVPGYDEAEWC